MAHFVKYLITTAVVISTVETQVTSGDDDIEMNVSNTSSVNSSMASTTTAPPGAPDEYYDIVRHIRFYSLSIIIPMGIITNLLALYVFFKSPMRKTTAGHYLISLSIADTFLLLGELLMWLCSFKTQGTYLGITFMNTSTFWCRMIHFIRYFGRLWSSWLTVIITVERYITVAFPLQVASISTTTKAKVVIIVELLITAVAGSYPFFTLGVLPWGGTTRCLVTHSQRYKIWSWIVIRCNELLLPSIIVVIFTTLIIYKVTKASSERRSMAQGIRTKEARRAFQDHQVTLVLLGVAISFVIIRLPYMITFYLNDRKKAIWEPLDPWVSFWIYAAYAIAYVLSVVNYATHFFIYYLCGSAFRVEMMKVFCKRYRLRDVALTFVSQRSRNESQRQASQNGRSSENGRSSRNLVNGKDYKRVNTTDVMAKPSTSDSIKNR